MELLVHMKHFITFACLWLGSTMSANALDIHELAECSAHMNNFNHKYGSHLLDNGYTHNTVNNDKLYYSSGSFQIGVHVQTAINENWNLNSYQAYRKSIKDSRITNLIFKYDTTEIQKLELSEMRARAFSTRCVDLLRSFIGANTTRETFEETTKMIMPFLEKMRGF